MRNDIDENAIVGRYEFPGNLKLSVRDIEAPRLSQKDLDQVADVLTGLRGRLLKNCKHGEDSFCRIPLTKTKTLCVDYYSNKLNLYIEDNAEKRFAQRIDLDLALALVRKEQNIIAVHERSIKDISMAQEQQYNKLIQKIVHSAYNETKHNRGSPRVFGKKLDDDFTLDR